MKILYVKLTNYIGLFIGSGVNEVEVEFTKSTSPITMLLGPNGKGKTTLLSALHPLAEVIDDDKSSIILEGLDGEKLIHFIDDMGNIFYIRHYYKAEKNHGHSIKSYIDKYDVISQSTITLNPNGNRNSFHQHIYEELGIDSSYLKLSSMGVNMTSFIKFKAAKRKEFMSNILSETDIYLQYYKKVSIKSRDSKAIINSLTSKISKLPDKVSLDTNLFNLQQTLNDLKTSKELILDKLSSLKTQIELIDPDYEMSNQYNVVKKAWNKVNTVYNNTIDSLVLPKENTVLEYYYGKLDEGIIDKLKNDRSHMILEKEKLSQDFEDNNKKLEENRGRLKEKEISKDRFTSNILLEDLLSMRKSIDEDIIDLSKNPCLDVSIEELKTLQITLEKVENIIASIYSESNFDILNKVNEYMLKNTGIDTIRNNLKQVVIEHENSIKKLSQITTQIDMLTATNIDFTSIRPNGCNNDKCPHLPVNIKKKLDSEIYELNNQKELIEEKISTLSNEIEISSGSIKVIESMLMICSLMESHKNVIDVIPDSDIKICCSMLSLAYSICSLKSFTNITNISSLFEYAESSMRLKNLKNIDKPKIESDILIAQNNETMLTEITKDINIITSDILNLEWVVTYGKKEIKNIELELQKIDSSLSLYEEVDKVKELKDRFKVIDREKTNLEFSMSNILNMQNKMEELDVNLKKIILDINHNTQELKNVEFQQNLYTSYYNELEEIRDKYLYIEHIKRALSSSEGIPLEFIEDYLEETKIIANELLQYAFDGELKIVQFQVTDDDFNIICDFNGQVIKDVTLLSGGQKAIVGLVFSVALVRQMSSIYNVFLLDEVDGTLDEENRVAFLFMLENIIKALNVQSVNIISHNNAFDSYDVNLILFGDYSSISDKIVLTKI